MNNTITGNAGNNGLDGGSGADTISGARVPMASQAVRVTIT
ncbi:hypothetical protein ABI_22100 [Asticcacaulis biprosthecium C19]|uniref:Uncharacterized protein n=1 Tax=Asticcacaulis biprosthecium C19 TaxID=715226 RepID=F4QH15_9CAUL|nr:hypothetical protein ABI_22100 [Asticcacaulis biprosthecium C19]